MQVGGKQQLEGRRRNSREAQHDGIELRQRPSRVDSFGVLLDPKYVDFSVQS